MNTKSSLIQTLHLLSHPEGGFYRESYRSQETCSTQRGARSVSTGIYFLLGAEDRSRFHVIQSDEMWHHYEGATLEIHEITLEGIYKITLLGKNLSQGQVPQYTVPKGHIFGSRISPLTASNSSTEAYTLVGCTVAPGFDFEDFHLFSNQALIDQFPHLRSSILSFYEPTPS